MTPLRPRGRNIVAPVLAASGKASAQPMGSPLPRGQARPCSTGRSRRTQPYQRRECLQARVGQPGGLRRHASARANKECLSVSVSVCVCIMLRSGPKARPVSRWERGRARDGEVGGWWGEREGGRARAGEGEREPLMGTARSVQLWATISVFFIRGLAAFGEGR